MKFRFSYLMLFLSLAVAGCAAYFSIWGLSQLFAGASTAVIIMASVLELGKIVTTTALHTYWHKLAKTLKIYLTVSVGVLMIITSAGIYGFLSNAYQKTANQLEIHEGEINVLNVKKDGFQSSIDENKKLIDNLVSEKDATSNRVSKRTNGVDYTNNSQSRRADIAEAKGNDQLNKLKDEIAGLNAKNSILLDSVNKYNVKVLELKSNSKVAGEVGPLKYVSELTGVPMGNVVNYMILLLIFVFDPLAIALILATNRVFELEGREIPLEPKLDLINYDGIPNPATPSNIVEEEEEEEDIPEPQVPSSWLSINDNIDEGVNEGVNEGINEGINEGVNEGEEIRNDFGTISEETGEIELSEELLPIQQELIFPTDEDDDAVSDAVSDAVNEIEPWDIRPIEEEIVEQESTLVSESQIEVPIHKKEPVVTTGKITLEDIKEIKENRGYSVPVPQGKGTNTIERIGQNPTDNNKFFFKRR